MSAHGGDMTRKNGFQFGLSQSPFRRRMTAFISAGGLLCLTSVEPGIALPLYGCAGIGVIVDSYSYTVLNPKGQGGCVPVTNGALTLNGALHAAVPLSDPSSANFSYDSFGRFASDTGSDPTTA